MSRAAGPVNRAGYNSLNSKLSKFVVRESSILVYYFAVL